MTFTEVKRAHIVPVSYLRNFSENDQLGVCIAKTGTRITSTPRKVGWRKHFYSRTRPDGTRIDDVEWAMSQLESAVAPLLRDVEARWPLIDSDKAILAEFAALQILRTPRFREWHHNKVESWTKEAATEASLEALTAGIDYPVLEHHVVTAAAQLRSETQTVTQMLQLLDKAASILGSMHWALLRFPKPQIATSDQPIHVWSMERPSSQPMAARIDAGLLTALEVRLPLSPTLVLLMSWLPQPDTCEPTSARRHYAKNINAFTIAETDQQWFHLPGTAPPIGAGPLLPIAPELHRGYNEQTAASSPLRVEVSRRVQPKIGAPLSDQSRIEITRVRSVGDS